MEGGPLLWIWPLYLHVNQKSDDDDDEVKICQNLQRRKVKIYMCSDTLNGKNFQKICVTLQWHRPLRYVNGQF